MERIKELFDNIRKYPVTSVRYILVVTGIFVTFSNFLDCFNHGAGFDKYFMYVIVIFIITMLLVFISHNSIVCFVIALTGMLMIFDADPGVGLSGGAVFVIFSKRIAENLLFSISIYVITILAVIANHTFYGRTPADSINVIIGYFAIYLIDYILSGVKKTS